MTPRRSVLYMPGANERAMEKARGIDCDGVIFDLEDAVAPEVKPRAREQIAAAILAEGYGHRELVVRANGLDTPWGADDIARMAALPIAAMLFPKVETAAQVAEIVARIDAAGGAELAVWIMIETPLGVQNVENLAASSDRVTVLAMGTSDLVKELRGRHRADRAGVTYALQRCVIAARAAGKEILDGVHLDFRDMESFREACEQGRDLGFDGKTLIHPTQVAVANAVFGPSADEIDFARRARTAWEAARAAGKGVAEVDGRLVENMHVAEAERTLAFADALAGRR
ncbi:MAG: CoA ester lyase [Gammaproteobacteria bacterium]|nr:CoA ester lyase [Gammaproteobacteria bacterium]